MTEFSGESFEELGRLFSSQYEVCRTAAFIPEVLGEGSYGIVVKARNVRTGELVAMKVSKESNEEGVPSTAIREVALLKQLSHPNVVKLLDISCSTDKLVLVFEFVEHDLRKYMKSVGGVLEPKIIQYLSCQLCDGIQFCHANRILHRDLKPQNLLIDSQLRLKIADFGLARPYSVLVRTYTPEVFTVWYRPPEILLGCTLYSASGDIWSFGCTVAEMAIGSPLFPGDSEIGTIYKIFEKLGTPTVEEWPGLMDMPQFKPTFPKWARKGWENICNTQAQIGVDGMDLLDRLLAYNPRRRVHARTALQHPYFAGTELPR